MIGLLGSRTLRQGAFAWRRCIFAIGITLVTSFAAHAMSPGASSSYWKPELVPGLSSTEIAYLKAAHCLIESYRTDQEAGPRKSPTPDRDDRMMLVRGEFASKGQADIVVYCKSAESEGEFFLVKWGGRMQCPSKFSLSELSNFFGKHGAVHDYYGDSLQGRSSKEVQGVMDDMYQEGDLVTSQQWRMNGSDVPVFEHDTLNYIGYYDLFLYCEKGKWLKLFDRYSDEID